MTVSTNDIVLIRAACAQFKVSTPKPVQVADALHDATVALLTSVRDEAVPDIEALSLGNLRTTHEAMVARTTWPQRERAAVELESAAAQRQLLAWHLATPGMIEAFRVPFDRAGQVFTVAHTALGGIVDADRAIDLGLHEQYRALVQAGADLATLAAVRDGLANSAGTSLDRIEDIGTRVVVVPDRTTLFALPSRQSGGRRYGLAWWTVLLGMPGTAIKWSSPAEQEALELPTKLAA